MMTLIHTKPGPGMSTHIVKHTQVCLWQGIVQQRHSEVFWSRIWREPLPNWESEGGEWEGGGAVAGEGVEPEDQHEPGDHQEECQQEPKARKNSSQRSSDDATVCGRINNELLNTRHVMNSTICENQQNVVNVLGLCLACVFIERIDDWTKECRASELDLRQCLLIGLQDARDTRKGRLHGVAV